MKTIMKLKAPTKLKSKRTINNKPKAPHVPEFFTVYELSKKLNIPKSSLYFFVRRGEIPGLLKVGRHLRFRRDIIEQWIEEQTRSRVEAKKGG